MLLNMFYSFLFTTKILKLNAMNVFSVKESGFNSKVSFCSISRYCSVISLIGIKEVPALQIWLMKIKSEPLAVIFRVFQNNNARPSANLHTSFQNELTKYYRLFHLLWIHFHSTRLYVIQVS